MRSLTLTEARNQLLRIAAEIEQEPDVIIDVVKRGKRIMTLMSADLYESLIETLEVLNDESTSTRLRQALEEIRKGKAIPWVEAKKKLRIEG